MTNGRTNERTEVDIEARVRVLGLKNRHWFPQTFLCLIFRATTMILLIWIQYTGPWRGLLKVSKSRKQIMMSLILPKKRTKHTQDSILSEFRSFFGRIRDFIICFWYLLTFSMWYQYIFRCRPNAQQVLKSVHCKNIVVRSSVLSNLW